MHVYSSEGFGPGGAQTRSLLSAGILMGGEVFEAGTLSHLESWGNALHGFQHFSQRVLGPTTS